MTQGDGVPRTLVGGVGYHDLRDFSVGPHLSRTLSGQEWPDPVVVEDLSYNPVKVVHRLQGEDPPFQRWVVAGSARRGRTPGSVSAYRWDGGLPDDEEVQARVAEAVTGVVGLDNLLIVVAALEAAPPEVYVVEVEPDVEEMGNEFTARVEEATERAAELVRELALRGERQGPLPEASLGGFRTVN